MTTFAELDFISQSAIVYCDRFGNDQIEEFNRTADKSLWIEHNVLDPLGLPGITTSQGLKVADNVEDFLESVQAEAYKNAMSSFMYN